MRRAASSPRWAWVVLTLLCVAAVVVAVLVVGPESAPAAKSRTVTAERGVVQSTVSGSGTIQARQTNVNFASAGQLTDVKVKAGQHVVEGQVLAHVKSQSAELSLEQAEAQLRSAQASLDSAEAQATASTASSATATTSANEGASGPTGPSQNQSQSQNQSSNSNSNSNSASSQASKQAAVAQAQAQVDSAEAAVENAQQGVSDTTLTSPVSGTVASVNAGVGDYVSGGGSSNASAQSSSNNSNSSSNNNSSSQSNSSSSGSAFIVIVDMNHLDLVVPFSESDIHKIKLHQPATVSVNALPEEQIAASVTSIDTLPTTNNSVTSYNVTFRLDQHASGIKPGMSASATVVVERVDDAVNVVTAAISRGVGGSTVTVVKDGKAVRQQVSTGITGDSTTQILSGLNAGDQVQVPIVTNSATAGGGTGTGRLGGGDLGGGLGGGGGGAFRVGGGGGFAGPPGGGP
jgi:membrane fusion protein, macrolide-specific efflux system